MCYTRRRNWVGFAGAIASMIAALSITKIHAFRSSPVYLNIPLILLVIPFCWSNHLILERLCVWSKRLIWFVYLVGGMGTMIYTLALWRILGLRHIEDSIFGTMFSTYFAAMFWTVMHVKWYRQQLRAYYAREHRERQEQIEDLRELQELEET